MGEKIINLDNLYALLDLEPYVILCALILLAWAFYKLFLREVSDERHRNLKRHFRNLFRHFLMLSTLFLFFLVIRQATNPNWPLMRALPYLGILSLLWGIIVFVKVCRLVILQYLFLGSIKHGVPVLIVNIFSLLMSIILAFWVAAHIFSIQLTPLLATSAAFSIVLGLALQDTLGNLFAGISLQVDKSFEIGDWLEVTNGSQKTVGLVKEITWRATVFSGWTEELITIPNRVLANSQIANFSLGYQPIIRSQMFRVPYGTDLAMTKKILAESVKDISSIRSWPEPVVIISETTDSWITLKLVYYIDNYGTQYGVADQVVEAALGALAHAGIHTASQRLQVQSK